MNCGLLFFLFFAMQTLPGRFSALFLQVHNLSPSEIGILFSVGNFAAIIGTLFFSVVSDKSKSPILILIFLTCASSIFLCLHSLALPGVGVIPTALRFIYLLAIYSTYNFVDKPMAAIVTAICVEKLRQDSGEDGPSQYGEHRVWGTISWGLGSLFVGTLFDSSNINIFLVYIGNVFFSLLFAIYLSYVLYISSYFEKKSFVKKDIKNETMYNARNRDDDSINLAEPTTRPRQTKFIHSQRSETTPKEPNGLKLLLQTIHAITLSRGIHGISFFMLLMSLGIGMAVVTALQFLFFYNELHASGSVCGLAVVITVIFEIPMFAKSRRLLNYVGSEFLIVIGAFCYGFRTIGYALIPIGWVVLFLEPMHGVTFAAMQTAGVAYVAQYGPPGADSTAQAVFLFIRSVSNIIGVAIGGKIMELTNGRILYGGLGIFVLSVTILFIVIRYCNQMIEWLYGQSTHIGIDEKLPLIQTK